MEVPVVDGPFSGTLLASMTSYFSGDGFSGELRCAAYSNDQFAGDQRGTDFYYQILNDSRLLKPIQGISQFGTGTIDNFPHVSGLDKGWVAQNDAAFGIFTTGTAKAAFVTTSVTGYCNTFSCLNFASRVTTNFVGFDWLGSGPIMDHPVLHGIAPGTASYTGAFQGAFGNGSPTYALGTLYVDGQFVNALVSTVPEPETYALILAGLGVVGGAIRRRKNLQAHAHVHGL
jgi:hypothetical protein